MTTTLLAAALPYGAQGWAVLPCKENDGPGAKAPYYGPYLHHGFRDATTDTKIIRQWWTTWPNAMIGLAIPANMLIIDVDGGDLATLESKAGAKLPPTRTVITGRTGGRGRHYYYRAPGTGTGLQRAVKIVDGVDMIPGGTGYVIAPPSIHPASGQPYRLQVPAREVATLPAPFIDLLRPAQRRTAPTTTVALNRRSTIGWHGLVNSYRRRWPGPHKQGARHVDLRDAALTLASEGQPEQAYRDLAVAGVDAGLDPAHVARTISDARAYIARGAQ